MSEHKGRAAPVFAVAVSFALTGTAVAGNPTQRKTSLEAITAKESGFC
jgi:hypothetical protein